MNTAVSPGPLRTVLRFLWVVLVAVLAFCGLIYLYRTAGVPDAVITPVAVAATAGAFTLWPL